MNVLIVDDSDIIRRMIVKTMRLAEVAATVHEASNGREALTLMEGSFIDVVLADLNMPLMNGIEMIERMRASEDMRDIPVVVVSTEGAESRILDLERLGISAYLRKPFTPEQIRDVFGRLPGLPVASRLIDSVESVTCEVLERFTLLFAESVPCGGRAPGGELLLGRIGLRGAVSGIVSIAAPATLCREMAVNALGAEESGPDSALRATDALGEVANMVAGHVATSIDARDATRLSPPVVTRLTGSEWVALEGGAGTVRLDVEGEPLLASFAPRNQP